MWSVDSHIDLDASPAEVWRLYEDPLTWSRWGHSTSAAVADGPLAEGATVSVKPTRGPTQRVHVVTFEPERRLVTELTMPGARMKFAYEIEARAEGCRVRHSVTMDGPLSGILGTFMRDRNKRKLAEEIANLAREVEPG